VTDPELEQLARLWRRPDAAEQAMFEKMARRARLKARLIGYGDLFLFFAIIVTMSLVVIRHRSATGIALGLLILAAVAALNRQRRIYRQASWRIDTSRTDAFLDSAIGSARARMRTVMLGLHLTLPFMCLTIIFLMSMGGHITRETGLSHVPQWVLSPRGTAIVLMFVLMTVLSVVLRYRIGKEIERLERLKRSYEEEDERDGEG
jgi:hypothetical protein